MLAKVVFSVLLSVSDIATEPTMRWWAKFSKHVRVDLYGECISLPDLGTSGRLKP